VDLELFLSGEQGSVLFHSDSALRGIINV